MERRFVPMIGSSVAIQTREDKPPMISGYAAVFFREDDPGTQYELFPGLVERILPGAFDRALSEADDCRGLFNHDPNQLLGRTKSGTLRLSIDAKGLKYEIDAPDTQTGRDACTMLERGDLAGSSFSFMPDDVTWRETGDTTIREVRSLHLYDVGPVTFPAYESTSAGVRALGDVQEARAALEKHQADKLAAIASATAAIAGYRARAAEVATF